tara:strand:- start:850 stop:1380 length:531 start_codon:yes stop_codon:yes gene_type:complete
MEKSWITNPRGSKDAKRKTIRKEGDGGFGEGGGTVFTSDNAGVFTPTHSERGPQKKKKKATGIERLGDFLTDNSPERKMVKEASLATELIKWVTEEFRKEDKTHFRQQTSGDTINQHPEVPRIDWKKDKKEITRKNTVEVQEPENDEFIRNIFKELNASEEIVNELDLLLVKTSAE